MKHKKLLLVASMLVTSSFISIQSTKTIAKAEDTEYTYIEGGWQYYSQSDTNVSKDFKRTPYIADVVSTAPSNYYSSISNQTGSTLKSALKSIISGPTTNYDWSRFEIVDVDPNNTDNVFCVYARSSYGKSDHVSGNAAYKWNREHSYPQSKLSGSSTSDTHLIFADDWKTNGVRSNYPYGEVTHSTSNLVPDSAGNSTANYYSGGYFEPTDAAKGEVARATLYTYTLYDEPIEDNFSSIALLLEWHLRYPVTTWEILRNNRNYSEQGNRNPFIDHPEYACSMLKDTNSNTLSACENTTPITMQGEETDTDVNNVISLINKIGTVTLNSESAILAAENAYDALTTAQKENVTNYQTLVDARSTYDSLVEESNQRVENVISLINNIGTVTTESLSDIEVAEEAYNNLSSDEKNRVTNYQTLLDARNEYNTLTLDENVANVINLINAIGTVTIDSKDQIETAEAAYAALSDELKAQVTNYQTLVDARNTYDELVNPSPTVSDYIFSFYNSAKLTSTSGSTVNLSYVQGAETSGNGSIITASSNSGTVQYNKNGGLTLGSGSATGTLKLTFSKNVVKVEIYGTVYDSGSNIKINSTSASSGSLGSKGSTLETVQSSDPLVFDLSSSPTTELSIASTTKRATIYVMNIYVESGSKLNTLINTIKDANTCVDYVNVNDYMELYNSLSDEEKETFANTTDDNGINLLEKLKYMQSYFNYIGTLEIENNVPVIKDYKKEVLPYMILLPIVCVALLTPVILVIKKKYHD